VAAGDEAIKALAAAQRMRNVLLAVVAMLLTAVAGLLLWQIRSG
jgi:VIT1/CCC1 family predicted Fe2+/Mn2+ transporter